MAEVDEGDRSYVILTRAEAQSQQLHDVLLSEGIKSLICPLLTLQFEDIDWPDPDSLQAIICTSARAIEAMIHADVLDRYRALPCFCVGGDTAQLARDEGVKDVHVGAGGAQALEMLVRSALKPRDGTLFYPCARDVAYPLGEALEKARFAVEQRAVYSMALSPQLPPLFLEALRDGEVGCITFYSARTARHFAHLAETSEIAQSLDDIKVLCISESVLEYVRPLNWASTHVAQTPDGSGMMESIERICAVET